MSGSRLAPGKTLARSDDAVLSPVTKLKCYSVLKSYSVLAAAFVGLAVRVGAGAHRIGIAARSSNSWAAAAGESEEQGEKRREFRHPLRPSVDRPPDALGGRRHLDMTNAEFG
jgi:hypothetical protein